MIRLDASHGLSASELALELREKDRRLAEALRELEEARGDIAILTDTNLQRDGEMRRLRLENAKAIKAAEKLSEDNEALSAAVASEKARAEGYRLRLDAAETAKRAFVALKARLEDARAKERRAAISAHVQKQVSSWVRTKRLENIAMSEKKLFDQLKRCRSARAEVQKGCAEAVARTERELRATRATIQTTADELMSLDF